MVVESSKFLCDPSNPDDPIMKRARQLENERQEKDDSEPIQYIDEEGKVNLAVAILKESGNLKLWGPTGTGKSLLARYLAQQLKARYLHVQFAMDTQPYEFMTEPRVFDGNSWIAVKQMIEFLLYDGPALLALHEVNLASSAVLGKLYDLTDWQREVAVPDLGVVLPRTRDKYVVITYNPAERSEYAGTNELNIAFLRRFEGFEVDYLPASTELRELKRLGLSHRDAEKLTQMARLTREAYQTGDLRTPITLGNMKAWAGLITNQGLELSDIRTLILGMYPKSQHGVVLKYWGVDD